MPIVPDTKGWTWVLERRCDECRFDASALPATAVPAVVRGNAYVEQDPARVVADLEAAGRAIAGSFDGG